jgi:hypothetical protein
MFVSAMFQPLPEKQGMTGHNPLVPKSIHPCVNAVGVHGDQS